MFGLLGKEPEAVVVSFWTGEDSLARRMVGEMLDLLPGRRHYVVAVGRRISIPGCAPIELKPGDLYLQLRHAFRSKRIALAPVLFTEDPSPLRAAAFCLAPAKILAYNRNLERHHLKLRTAIASLLFVRGVPLDRIFLRPTWLCPWKKDRSEIPDRYHLVEGRPLDPARRRVAVLSPYFPYPLSHGGAVRIYHLLREAASEFDIFLFAFAADPKRQEFAPLQEFCAKIVVVAQPRYREPRWSTLLPPEVREYDSPPMRRLLEQHGTDLRQVEYTQLSPYGGDILVEHDVTWDLYRQVYERKPTLSAWWDYFRWKRFETRVIPRYRRVVAMSPEDRKSTRLNSSHIQKSRMPSSA